MDHLTLKVEDGVAIVTFDNPPLSVMTPQTVHELFALLPRLGQADVRAVVLTGTGDAYFIRHFSVEELSASAEGSTRKWDVNMDDVLLALESLPKVVITALNGTALGGGLEVALATDMRVGKDANYRYGLPEISVGILPGGGGTQRLSALIGRQKALLMMLRARLLTCAEAFEAGIIDELVPADTAESALDRALAIARDIAGRSPLAVAHIKRLARESVNPVTKEMLTLESKLFGELMRTDEARALLANAAGNHRKERGG